MNITVGQGGKSTIGNLIVLGLVGFGVWVGIQYIPQKIEQGTVQSVLDRVEQRHQSTPIQDDRDLWQVIDRQLSVNEMNDMRHNFDVSRAGGRITIRVTYERELNLIFTTKKMRYNESVSLP